MNNTSIEAATILNLKSPLIDDTTLISTTTASQENDQTQQQPQQKQQQNLTKATKRALQELDEKNWLLECEDEAKKHSFKLTVVHKQVMLRTYRLKKALQEVPLQALITKAKCGCRIAFSVLGERLANDNGVQIDGRWESERVGTQGDGLDEDSISNHENTNENTNTNTNTNTNNNNNNNPLEDPIDLNELVHLGQTYGTVIKIEPCHDVGDIENVLDKRNTINQLDLPIDNEQSTSNPTNVEVQPSRRRYRISIDSNMNDDESSRERVNSDHSNSLNAPQFNQNPLNNNQEQQIPSFFASYLTIGLATQKHSHQKAQKVQRGKDQFTQEHDKADPSTPSSHSTSNTTTTSSTSNQTKGVSKDGGSEDHGDGSNQCHFYYVNNSRCVWPYPIKVICNMKPRHNGMVLKDMINAEFPSFHSGYLEHCVGNGRLLINEIAIVDVGENLEKINQEDQTVKYHSSTLPYLSSRSIPTIHDAENGPITINITGGTSENIVGYSLYHYKIKQGDILYHMTHSHEPPVPADDIEIAFNPHKIGPSQLTIDNTIITPNDTNDNLNINHHSCLAQNDVDNIIIVNKPSGIPVHATGRYRHNTIIGILMNHFAKQRAMAINNSKKIMKTDTNTAETSAIQSIIPSIPSLHIVHRLDIATSGLFIIATSLPVAQKMTNLMSSRSVQKHYLARVKGYFPLAFNAIDPVTNVNAIDQMIEWGRNKWANDYNLENGIKYLSPCDGFTWSSSNQSKNDLMTNGSMMAWNGVGIRTIQSLIDSRESSQNDSPSSQLQDSTNWSPSTLRYGIEVVVDRPIQKHHQNNSSNVEGGIDIDQKLNQNGNFGVMETPYLLPEDITTFNDANKFTDSVFNNNNNNTHTVNKGDKKKNTKGKNELTTTTTPPQQPTTHPNPTKKSSLTIFRGLVYDPVSNTTLIHCLPKTGRTHQIRIHLAHLGYPIDNDDMYIPLESKYMSPGAMGQCVVRQGDDCNHENGVYKFVFDHQHYDGLNYSKSNNNKQSLTETNQKHKFCDRIPSIAQYDSEQILKSLWKQSYDQGCCFCEDVNAGLWPEKKLYVDINVHLNHLNEVKCEKCHLSDAETPPSSSHQSSSQSSSSPYSLFPPTNFITGVLPSQVEQHGDNIKLASFTYQVSPNPQNCAHVADIDNIKQATPNTIRTRDITIIPTPAEFKVDLDGVINGPYNLIKQDKEDLCKDIEKMENIPKMIKNTSTPGPFVPLNISPSHPPHDIISSFHWDVGTMAPVISGYQGEGEKSIQKDEDAHNKVDIFPNILPPIPSIDVRREYIHLHATRYETKEWSFCVETPDWAWVDEFDQSDESTGDEADKNKVITEGTSEQIPKNQIFIPCSYYTGLDTASNYCPIKK